MHTKLTNIQRFLKCRDEESVAPKLMCISLCLKLPIFCCTESSQKLKGKPISY
jgi:hypothetical protein